jgi:hypothetical protein
LIGATDQPGGLRHPFVQGISRFGYGRRGSPRPTLLVVHDRQSLAQTRKNHPAHANSIVFEFRPQSSIIPFRGFLRRNDNDPFEIYFLAWLRSPFTSSLIEMP